MKTYLIFLERTMAILSSDLKYFKSLYTVAAGAGNGNTHDLEVTSLGGGLSAVEISTGVVHDLFDSVSSAEAIAGRIEHRLIYVTNEHATLTLYDATVFVNLNTSSVDSTLEIGLDPVAGNGADSVIELADETDSGSALTAVTFTLADGFANGINIGHLAAGEQRAIWLRRTILAGATAGFETTTLAIRGDTDA
jgi:hypothetical protein